MSINEWKDRSVDVATISRYEVSNGGVSVLGISTITTAAGDELPIKECNELRGDGSAWVAYSGQYNLILDSIRKCWSNYSVALLWAVVFND